MQSARYRSWKLQKKRFKSMFSNMSRFPSTRITITTTNYLLLWRQPLCNPHYRRQQDRSGTQLSNRSKSYNRVVCGFLSVFDVLPAAKLQGNNQAWITHQFVLALLTLPFPANWHNWATLGALSARDYCYMLCLFVAASCVKEVV